MSEMNRRRFCALAAALGCSGTGLYRLASAQEVKYSAGTEKPRTGVPAGATDCHMHFFDKRAPTVPGAPVLHPDALADDYLAFQRRISTRRCVVVQPSAYGTDNQVMLSGLKVLGDNARGVAVVSADVPDSELQRLHSLGVRGVRFNLVQAGAISIEKAKLLSPRLKEMGWHIQFYMPGERLVEAYELLASLPSPVVFDHMARIPLEQGTAHPSYAALRRLLDKGNTWVKLSGPYLSSKQAPHYPDASKLAQEIAKAAPERVVWASDWPHATEKDKPDDAVLFDLLSEWVPNEAARRRVLVANPAALYDFHNT